MGMTKETFKLLGRMRAEQVQTQKAGRKRGLWSSIGSTLLGGLAAILTAGAATPAVIAALATGGASFAGGHLANWAAGRTKEGDLSGGRYYKEERKDLGKQIEAGINVGALKAGVQQGFMKVLKGMGKKKPAPLTGEELVAEKSAQIDKMLETRSPLGDAPTFDEMMSSKKPSGPGFQASDQVFPAPVSISDAQQKAVYSDIARRYNLDISKMEIGGGGAKTPISSVIDPTKGKDWPYYGPADVAVARGKESTFSQMLEEGPAYITDRLGKGLYKGSYSPGKNIVESSEPFSRVKPSRPEVSIDTWDILDEMEGRMSTIVGSPQQETIMARRRNPLSGNITEFEANKPDLFEFDEALWGEGDKILGNIDNKLFDKQASWQNRFFPEPGGFDPEW